MRGLKVIPLAILIPFLSSCGTDTDDPILDQMKAAEIVTGGMDGEKGRKMVGMLGTATKNTWSAHETEDFVELAYANGCPDSRL